MIRRSRRSRILRGTIERELVTHQVPLLLEERIREQVLQRHAPVSLPMVRGDLPRARAEVAEERLIIGEGRVGRGVEVALLAPPLVLLLEPVHLQYRRERASLV